MKKRILTVKVVTPWISVKDDLPPPWLDVLVYYPNSECGKYCIDCIDADGRFTYDGLAYHNNATHWMPLPKKPDGVTENVQSEC